MATMNGVVPPAAQDTQQPSTPEEPASATAPSSPPAEGSLDAAGTSATNGVVPPGAQDTQQPSTPEEPAAATAGTPAPYRDRFFAVLQDLVTSGPMDSKTPRHLFGYRPDVMARLLTLCRRLDDGGTPVLYQQASLAAQLWKTHPSTGSTVSAVVDDIEFATSRNSPIYTVMHGLIASVLWLSLGTLAFLTLYSFVSWMGGNVTWDKVIKNLYEDLRTSPFLIAAIFGMLGAVVSVLVRLSDFENAQRRSRQFLRMNGVVLPLVGVVFACVTYALLTSDLISFSFPVKNNISFCIVLGFLSGFSERFTRGLLGSVEQSLMTTRSEVHTTLRTDDGATLDNVTKTTKDIKSQAPTA